MRLGPKKLLIAVVAAVLITALIIWLNRLFPGPLTSNDGALNIVQSLLVLALVGGSVLLHGQIKLKNLAYNFLLWLPIVGVLLVGFSFRFEINEVFKRVMTELIPSQGRVIGEKLLIPMSQNGHFVVDGKVNGRDVQFLIDTGASDVVLSPQDATRIGIDIKTLNFNKIFNTANGQGAGASVLLPEIRVGPIVLNNVRASVNQKDMDTSLLGMSFLNRLSGYRVSKEKMILLPSAD